VADVTGMTAEQQLLGVLTPHQADRETFREAQADASSAELGDLFNAPDKEPPRKAPAADAVAAAHQAIADTPRLNAKCTEQGPAAHWLAADDQAGRTAAVSD
jgi:hypothetical protein